MRARTAMRGDIVLASHFDPKVAASLIRGEQALELARLSGPPAVPIHHLAKGYVERGFDVTLLGGIQDAPDLKLFSSPVSAFVYGKRDRIAWVLDGFREERNRILGVLEELQPSIVHAHWTKEAARAVADWDGPKLLTVHDTAWEYACLGPDWNWGPWAHASNLRWLFNTGAVLRRFRHLVAVSPYVESYLRRRHGFSGEIRVIPNAIPEFPKSIRVKDAFPKTGVLTFGTYGGPGRLKGVGSAIAAMGVIRREIRNCRMVLFGSGWKEKHMRGADPSIEFRHAVCHPEFLRTLAEEVDVWIHPALIEAHPITICEAIQAGCPVVAGRNSGGVAWTLDHGRAGVMVDVKRPDEIAAAAVALVRDRKRAMQLVAEGQQMIRERFHPNRVIDEHLSYYESVRREWTRGGAGRRSVA